MADVKATDVRALLKLKSSVSLNAEVETANLIVTEDLAGSTLSAARLDKIRLYLAAHLYTMSAERGGLVKYKVGNTEEEYSGTNPSSKGLSRTPYGQQVIALDTTGILASKDSGTLRAQFRVVGTKDKSATL